MCIWHNGMYNMISMNLALKFYQMKYLVLCLVHVEKIVEIELLSPTASRTARSNFSPFICMRTAVQVEIFHGIQHTAGRNFYKCHRRCSSDFSNWSGTEQFLFAKMRSNKLLYDQWLRKQQLLGNLPVRQKYYTINVVISNLSLALFGTHAVFMSFLSEHSKKSPSVSDSSFLDCAIGGFTSSYRPLGIAVSRTNNGSDNSITVPSLKPPQSKHTWGKTETVLAKNRNMDCIKYLQEISMRIDTKRERALAKQRVVSVLFTYCMNSHKSCL